MKIKTAPAVLRGEAVLHGTTLMTPGRGVARSSCNGNPRPALAGSSETASGRALRGARTVPRSLWAPKPVLFLIAFAYLQDYYTIKTQKVNKKTKTSVDADLCNPRLTIRSPYTKII